MSESQNLTPTQGGRARRSSTLHRPNTAPSAKTRRVIMPQKRTQYVRGFKARERVDMVLQDLFEKHRWSIKDFIYHLVTEEPTKKQAMSCSARARALSKAIYQQEEVVERLASVSLDIRTVGNAGLNKRIRAELHALSKPEVGFGEFNPKADVNTLDIPALAERIQKAAPELWELLASLMEQQYASRRDTLTKYQGSMVMICSILAQARAPRKCNNLPMLLGLHLHSMGLKRRSLSVLAGLGVTSSYRVINTRRGELADIGKVSSLLRISPLATWRATSS
jgi:hypothetical protein